MIGAVRYRTGTNRETGKPLSGWAHVEQSLGVIWLTRLEQRVMRLAFGSNLHSHLAEDLTPATALAIYNDLVAAAHRWEPEYRIRDMQLVSLTQAGGLGLRHRGIYYPEGRFGNYAIATEAGATTGIVRREQAARSAA
ncbi:GPW/gp25 family protein [Methylopila sp. 73B]|uniref:GPW/gp25 family protein n=1 Tax=Methylopila sp. 73B TaxID=1120792 RepID=UPI00035C86D3|nr:GPW/gp25 family protein [Methylopila sp. 73B]